MEKEKVLRQPILDGLLADLLKSQYWAAYRIAEYQDDAFVRLIQNAFKYVPYYRDLAKKMDLSIYDFDGIRDIYKLPTLKKEHISGNERYFIDERIAANRLIKRTNIYGTGTPILLYGTEAVWSKQRAFDLRLMRWAQVSKIYRPRRVYFTGKVNTRGDKQKGPFSSYSRSDNTLYCSSLHIADTTVAVYAKAMRDFKPEWVQGDVNTLQVFSRLCLERHCVLPRVRAVHVQGNGLLDGNRSAIETAFDAPVFHQYGPENGCYCADNARGEMMVHPEFGFVEIFPRGEIISTCFVNPVMPLIRYSTGDIAIEADQPTENLEGHAFKRLKRIIGRVEDPLTIGGKYIGGLDSLFTDVEGVMHTQIVLMDVDHMVLNLVVNTVYDKRAEAVLTQKLRKKTETELVVDFRYVERIDSGSSGKYKAVVDLTKI